MPTIDPCVFLRRLPLFSGLADDELRAVGAATSEIHVDRGRNIVVRGDPCLGLHSIVYGQVKLGFVSAQGQEKVIEIVGPGKSFGEAVIFMGKPYFVTATVRLSVSKRLVASRLNITPEYFSRVLHDLITRRLVRVDGREIEILDAAGLRAYEG